MSQNKIDNFSIEIPAEPLLRVTVIEKLNTYYLRIFHHPITAKSYLRFKDPESCKLCQ